VTASSAAADHATKAAATAAKAAAGRASKAAGTGAKAAAYRTKKAAATGAKAAAGRASKAAATVSNAAADRVSKAAAVQHRAPRILAAVNSAPRRTVAALQSFSSDLAGLVADTLTLVGAVGSFDGAAPSSSQDAAPTTAGGVLTSRGGARPAIAASAQGHRAITGTAGPGTPAASGWRNASSAPVERVGGALAGFDAPTSQRGGPASAAASTAAAAAVALLGLLGLLGLIAQRHGAIVRLRSAFAPASPFLALPERPG
jgi:hypothetical protein